MAKHFLQTRLVPSNAPLRARRAKIEPRWRQAAHSFAPVVRVISLPPAELAKGIAFGIVFVAIALALLAL